MSDSRLLQQLLDTNAKLLEAQAALLARIDAMESRSTGQPPAALAAPVHAPAPRPASDRPRVDLILDDYLINFPKPGTTSHKVAKSTVKMLKETQIKIVGGGGATKRLGDFCWDELNVDVCARYLKARAADDGAMGTTATRNLNALQSALTSFVVAGIIPFNPINGWVRAQTRSRESAPSRNEWQELVKYGPPMFQDMLTVQHELGMRPGEARLLLKVELDYANKEITLTARTKNGKPRKIPAAHVWEIIERRVVESRGQYVFVNPRDPTRTQPVPDTTMTKQMETARNRSGMKGVGGENLVRYSGRHGGITTLIDEGHAPGNVAAVTGTSLEMIDDHYMHLRPDQRKKMQQAMNNRGLTPIDGGQSQRKGPSKAPGKLPRAVGDDDE
jgi:integrase